MKTNGVFKMLCAILICALLLSTCRKSISPPIKQLPSDSVANIPQLRIQAIPPPFSLPSGSLFFSNISYGKYAENVFDIFIPTSSAPTGLLIKIHGGGFKGGDKTENYSSQGTMSEINTYLSNHIAVATLNYRLLLDVGETEGVIKCLNDCKRALQFIRYYSKTFNISPLKVVLKGGSAGAGASLWIAMNNDMADQSSADPVNRQSTRVVAVVANNTQSTYDVPSWPNAVYSTYPSLTFDSMMADLGTDLILQFYGISNISDINSPAILNYRAKVDMLGLMSAGDPEIYLQADNIENVYPNTVGLLEHHPLQSKAVMDKALSLGVPVKAIIPKLGINTSKGEDAISYAIRKLNN